MKTEKSSKLSGETFDSACKSMHAESIIFVGIGSLKHLERKLLAYSCTRTIAMAFRMNSRCTIRSPSDIDGDG